MKLFIKIVFLLLLLAGFKVNAQLPVPVMQVIVLDETCDGTGQLTINLTGTAAGASILYSVFLLPDVTVPVYVGSNNVLPLAGGTYNVVAVQTLGSESNIVTQENIVIEDLVGALDYRAIPGNNPCGGGSQITIEVIAGEATQYEITSGPVTVPLQTSNVFTGLPEGEYIVRVYDPCGAAIPKNVVVAPANATPPVISNPIFEESLTTGCNSVSITNTLSYNQDTIIIYPLTVVYTIHFGDGSPDQVDTVLVPSGDTDIVALTHLFDLEPGQTDTYDIQITNGCGIVFPAKTGMVTMPVPKLTLAKVPIPCGQYYITVAAENFVPPYRLNFLSPPPAQFNPQSYNSGHPNFGDPVTVYGGVGNAIPVGTYTVEITDRCNRTATASIEVTYEKPEPVVGGANNGCFAILGSIFARVPSRLIVFAEIVRGPATFTEHTPFNVSSSIDTTDGVLRVPDLPTGEYFITLVDNCGDRHEEIRVVVPEFEERDFVATTQPDCAIGLGGVKVDGLNGRLVSMFVTIAPPEFNNGVTPLEVTGFIDAMGDLYMDALPEGDYRFEGTDECGIERNVDVTVVGAQIPPDTSVVLLPRCNAFYLDLFDTTAVSSATYWLQMESDNMPGQWVNPETGAVYTEGAVPNSTNSIALTNNQTNINFDYSGTFRVVKVYQAIGSGVAAKNCISVLGEPFSYSDDVIINDVYSLACRPNAVFVDAIGLPPLTYSIYEKDGLPFILDNGTDPVFTGLAPGIYRFRVENSCTEQQVTLRDITTIPSVIVANPVGDMQICIEQGDSNFQEFNLEGQTAQILGTQSPLIYTVTYHRTQADAISGNNALVSPYTNVRNPETIYARVLHNFINICPATVSFQITTAITPLLTIPEVQYICADVGRLVLSANEGHDDYVWTSTHPITQLSDTAIEVYEPGVYTVTVSNTTGTLPPCSSSVDIEVLLSDGPQNITFDIEDWTEHDNVIRVNVTGVGLYAYSLDGDNYQESSQFTGLDTGIYTVYIKDTSGCGIVTREVVLLNYPKYFTPNGDGVHETWHIKYSMLEPNLIVYIYDRFGKLITNFDAQSDGWDGTFNGQALPSTDYWFVVHRQDGRILKGHFSLLR